ncbi:uncharacterized protein LOC144168185 isoform X2 [Haemaphysalis longicornis]
MHVGITALQSKQWMLHCGQLQLFGATWQALRAIAVVKEATWQSRLHYATSSVTACLVDAGIMLDLLLELQPTPAQCALLSDFWMALL